MNNKIVSVLTLAISLTALDTEALEIDGISFTHKTINMPKGEISVAVGDINNDGHQDLLLASLSGELEIHAGDGRGNFVLAERRDVGNNPTDIAVADINNDGLLDIIVANHETTYLTLAITEKAGSSTGKPAQTIAIDVDPHPHIVKAVDMDRDGHSDLIVDSRNHEGLYLFKGNDRGEFESPGKLVAVGGDPYLGFALGDINGDGNWDIVTPNPSNIGIVFGTGPLTFAKPATIPLDSPFAIELADMTADGNLDVIVASESGAVQVIPGNGDGNFSTSKTATHQMAGGGKQIATGDINGDGITDAIISNWSSGALIVLGSKKGVEFIPFDPEGVPNPWGVALSDLNADGKSDIVVADGESGMVAVYLSE